MRKEDKDFERFCFWSRAAAVAVGVALIIAALATARAEEPAPLQTFRWNAEVTEKTPYRNRVFAGERVALEAALTNYKLPVAVPEGTPVALLWQTNGAPAEAWWKGGRVSADSQGVCAGEILVPDCEALRFFFRLGEPGGLNYSAFGDLAVMRSPGSSPAEPAPPPDGGQWATPQDLEALGEILREEMDDVANELWTAIDSISNAAPAEVDLSAYMRHDVPPPRTSYGWALQIPLADETGIGVFEAGGLHLYGSGHASKYLVDRIMYHNNSYFYPTGSGTLALKSDVAAAIETALADFEPSSSGGPSGPAADPWVAFDVGANLAHSVVVSNGHWFIYSSPR